MNSNRKENGQMMYVMIAAIAFPLMVMSELLKKYK